MKEPEWSYKGETKKSDVLKDPKDVRLLRLISEGLLNPQDTLPIVSNDAIISSQINSNYSFSNHPSTVYLLVLPIKSLILT